MVARGHAVLLRALTPLAHGCGLKGVPLPPPPRPTPGVKEERPPEATRRLSVNGPAGCSADRPMAPSLLPDGRPYVPFDAPCRPTHSPVGREAGGHGGGQVPGRGSPSQEPPEPDMSKLTFQVENRRCRAVRGGTPLWAPRSRGAGL